MQAKQAIQTGAERHRRIFGSTDSVANDSRLVFAEIALLPGSALSAHFLVRAQYVGSSERNPEDLERERSGLERDK